MITKTIKTLGLCMLILCSASIHAGIRDKMRGLKTSIINAEKNHPRYFYGTITASGALLAYYARPLKNALAQNIDGKPQTIVNLMRDFLHRYPFESWTTISLSAGAAMGIGTFNLIKTFIK